MMDNYKEIPNDEIEIDLKELILALWRKAWVLILSAIICGGVAFGYTSYFVTPLYQASSMIYILSTSTSITSYADLQLSAALTEDYEILGLSRPVLSEVIETLELDYSVSELSSMIELSNPADSHILSIKVTSAFGEEAMNIANEMADVVSDQVANVMLTDTPSIVERAVLAGAPSSPSVVKNMAIGVFLGLFLSAGIIVVLFILDDTIKDEDDVEKYLRKSVLATLPKNNKSKSAAKNNSYN